MCIKLVLSTSSNPLQGFYHRHLNIGVILVVRELADNNRERLFRRRHYVAKEFKRFPAQSVSRACILLNEASEQLARFARLRKHATGNLVFSTH